MPDKDKVIERLLKVSYYFNSLLAVGWQGDADIYREHRESVKMAIALLKDQEPVKPEFDSLDGIVGRWRCGNCHISIGAVRAPYCWHCGRKVKWND